MTLVKGPRLSMAALAALTTLVAGLGAAESVSALKQQLETETGLARRQAARKLITMGDEAGPAIMALTKDEDVVIRRNAIRTLRALLGVKAVPLYKDALADPSPLVRLVAVEELMAYEPRTDDVADALGNATQDADDEVRKRAAGAFWTFHRDHITLRKRPSWDHAIEVIDSKPLPAEGWLFRTDPGRVGHVERWFAPEINESTWIPVVADKWWHQALPDKVGNYEGVAWYRTEFTAPSKPEEEYNEAVLHFEAVDESTWVWVNGTYAGEHDMGPGGWNKPFDIEVGTFLNWGGPNVIAVRVLNTAGAGGIYKPVELQILK